MTEMTDDYDSDDEQQEPPRKNWRRDLEERARRGDELAKENAFLKAGIDPDDARLGYFVRGYNGEITREAIRKAAEEAGFLQSETVSQDEQRAHERVAQASAGAGQVGQSQDMNSIIRHAAGRS